jgi:tRNA(Arg) A34 adenosine deaminase TadA
VIDPRDETGFGLDDADFEPLGEFAPAGLAATRLALGRAARSARERRVPIAGAAVHMARDGRLTTIAVGTNGRIPGPEESGRGYPTDHGETATVRQIEDVAAIEWDRVVFTTTLSPCIMCNHTLAYLHGLGLERVVVAESESFGGTADDLTRLPGMQLLALTNEDAVVMMKRFARTYPWDWNADIGLIPPGNPAEVERVAGDPRVASTACATIRAETGDPPVAGCASAVIGPDGRLEATAVDARASRGGNPALSAPMLAIGRAGSAVNLRDCVLVVTVPRPGDELSLARFGHASLGACKLFRPGVVLTDGIVAADLKAGLEGAGVRVLEAT